MGDVTSGCGWANLAFLGGFTFGQCKQPPQDPSGALHAGSCCVHSGISWSGVDCQDDCPYGYTNELGDVTTTCGWLNAISWLGATVMGRCSERPPEDAMNDAYLTSMLMQIAVAKSYDDREEWNEQKEALRDHGYIVQSNDIESFHLIEAKDKTTFGEDGAHIVYFFGEHGGNHELVIGFPGSGSAHDVAITDALLAIYGGLDSTTFTANGETFRGQRSLIEHYESTRDQFLRQMDEILKKTCTRSCVDVIRLVGHSLGGTAAQFGAVDMAKRYGDNYDIWLSTYASPRAFESSSSDRVHSLLTTNGNMANRFMLYGDIVPWAGIGLKHVGNAYFIEKGVLYKKDRNHMPVDTKALWCCTTCEVTDNPLSVLWYNLPGVAPYVSCLAENHLMAIYLYNINLIKNNNRQYLEGRRRVPARTVTRKCSAFLPTCSDQPASCTDTPSSWAINNNFPCAMYVANGHDMSDFCTRQAWIDLQLCGATCAAEGFVTDPNCYPRTRNLVEENQVHIGSWGGSCTCPDGSVYQVGDNMNHCGSLACVGGVSGSCQRSFGPWAQRKVTCAAGRSLRRSLKN